MYCISEMEIPKKIYKSLNTFVSETTKAAIKGIGNQWLVCEGTELIVVKKGIVAGKPFKTEIEHIPYQNIVTFKKTQRLFTVCLKIKVRYSEEVTFHANTNTEINRMRMANVCEHINYKISHWPIKDNSIIDL